MALKDWKKEEGYYVWKNKSKVIQIQSDGFKHFVWFSWLKKSDTRQFKTKSAALRFAKSYMRKH